MATIEHPLTIIRNMMATSHYHQYLQSDLFKINSAVKDQFSSELANSVIALLNDYRTAYGKWPDGFTKELEDLILVQPAGPKVNSQHIQDLFAIDLEVYDQEVLHKVTQDLIKYSLYLDSLIGTMKDIQKLDTASERNTLMESYIERISDVTFDKKGALEGNLWDPSSYSSEEYTLLPTGFNYLDEMLSPSGHATKGGFVRGGLYSFMAPPKGGKSLFLANCATKVCMMGRNVAIASFEMSKDDYYRRILCHMFDIPTAKYDADKMSRGIIALKQKKEEIVGNEFGNLFVKQFSPINTPQDINSWVLSLEKTHKIKIEYVVVDYINLVKSGRSGKADNTYLSVKHVAEDLRGFGMSNGWTTVTATQTNRSGLDAEQLTMSQVSESFGLPATADAMIGIIKNEDIVSCNLIASRRSHFEGTKDFRCNWSLWKLTQVSAFNPGNEAFNQINSSNKLI
jgi:KaiC/GvpD/RAD55 family RecA-like ATPase